MAQTKTHRWSQQQNNIFNWFSGGTGHLIVRARAGTGKTTTIIEGIKHAPETKILLAAFNKRIATELDQRLENTNAEAKTLHAIGFSFVRRYWERIFIEKRPGARKFDLAEKVCGSRVPDAIIKLVANLHTKAREIAPHATKQGQLTEIMYQFDLLPDEDWVDEGYGVDFVEGKALEAMELAASKKPTATGIDFSDMIFLPVRNKWLSKKFELVVVDEAQDMTSAQLEIAQGVCSGRVCVVGDDRQAIYGFRGADSDSLDRLKAELNATELGLNTTYRCGTEIVKEAATLVPDFQAGPNNPEGKIISIPSDKLTDTAEYGDFILSRLNAPLVGIALSLLAQGKRTCIAGRDIGAGLKKLIRTLAKGHAANSIPKLLERISVWEEKQVNRILRAHRGKPVIFFASISQTGAQIDAIRDQAQCLNSLCIEAKSVDAVTKRIDALFTDNGLGQQGTITCSSVHKSKGLEADRVFILRKTLRTNSQEENNIQYVAITRAKSTLIWVEESEV